MSNRGGDKKPKIANAKTQYCYMTCCLPLTKGQVIAGDAEDIKQYLVRQATSMTEMLNDAAQRGTIGKAAHDYAHGDAYLTTNTAKARTYYTEQVFDTSILPKHARRRYIDAAASRIKDILKAAATKVKVAEEIEALRAEQPDLSESSIGAKVAQRIYAQVNSEDNSDYPKYLYVPNAAMVKNTRRQMDNNNEELPLLIPEFKVKLPLSKCDKQVAYVERTHDGTNSIILSLFTGNRKRSQVRFALPDKDAFRTGKVCTPDVTITDDGEVILYFAIKQPAPGVYEADMWLGVDVGQIMPFTMALVSRDWHSETVYPDDHIMDMNDKLEALYLERDAVRHDLAENERPGRPERIRRRAESQRAYLRELSARITTLKCDVRQCVAHRVCTGAYQYGAGIALEQLNWAESSTYFFRSMLQDAIVNLATRMGIPVVFVPAGGSSCECPFDGAEMTSTAWSKGSPVSRGKKRKRRPSRVGARADALVVRPRGTVVQRCHGRGESCPECHRVFEHDGVSPWSIGARGVGLAHAPRAAVRLRFRCVNWGLLSLPVAVSASAPVSLGPSVLIPAGVPCDATVERQKV